MCSSPVPSEPVLGEDQPQTSGYLHWSQPHPIAVLGEVLHSGSRGAQGGSDRDRWAFGLRELAPFIRHPALDRDRVERRGVQCDERLASRTCKRS